MALSGKTNWFFNVHVHKIDLSFMVYLWAAMQITCLTGGAWVKQNMCPSFSFFWWVCWWCFMDSYWESCLSYGYKKNFVSCEHWKPHLFRWHHTLPLSYDVNRKLVVLAGSNGDLQKNSLASFLVSAVGQSQHSYKSVLRMPLRKLMQTFSYCILHLEINVDARLLFFCSVFFKSSYGFFIWTAYGLPFWCFNVASSLSIYIFLPFLCYHHNDLMDPFSTNVLTRWFLMQIEIIYDNEEFELEWLLHGIQIQVENYLYVCCSDCSVRKCK